MNIMQLLRKQTRFFGILLALTLVSTLGIVPFASAAQSSSPHYSVDEAFFGNGGELNPCSTNYCSKQSSGETAVGNTSSSNYQAQAGFNSDRTPSLTLAVNSATINLGVLTPGTPAYTSATFSVKSYLSSGYIVQTFGGPPKNGTKQLTALTTPTAFSSSSEQFGVNLAANTSPATFGAIPSQAPNSTFGFGSAATGYNTANLYKYNNGDTIAQSLKSSGETDYTISYLLNVTALTAGGTYVMNNILVATATF